MDRLTIVLAIWLTSAGLLAAPPESAPTSKAAGDDVRDSILLLNGGPLHVRLKVSLEGTSLAAARRAFSERLLKSLDGNGDGKLSRDEAAKSPLLRVKQRESAKDFLKTLGVNEQTVGLREIEQEVDRIGGEAVVYRQDGSASAPDQEVFKFLDKNTDNLIDANEIGEAAERLMQKDEDRDQCITFDEFVPPPPPPDPMQMIVQPPPSRPAATTSNMMRDLGDPLLARRLVQLYDRNRSRTLDAAEIGWSAERVALLDQNKDRQLDEKELAGIKSTPVDLELAIDLAPGKGQQPAIRVLTTGAERLDNQDRPDFAKVRFRDAVITVSHRNIDPFAKTMEAAMQVFNRLDVDNNGYLEMSEVKDTRFERGLFELMDDDRDGKVFGEEMKLYVSARGEPAATTCRVNLYDTGFGFFLALDRNGDGRISERERRTMFSALTELNRDGKPGITAQEPVRHFHLELVRGTYTLFDRPDQLAVQTPAFQRRPPIGPSWFQALDRNNDGDVSWEEFLLSSRQEFDHIDADQDGLIDPNEAAKADEEYERANARLTRN